MQTGLFLSSNGSFCSLLKSTILCGTEICCFWCLASLLVMHINEFGLSLRYDVSVWLKLHIEILFFPKRSVLSSIQNTYPTGSKALHKAIWHNFLPLQCNKSFVGNKVNTNLTFVFSTHCVVEYLFIYLFFFIGESILGPGSRLTFPSCRTDC